VHQDGSCNGLQHYAALGRDAAGARSVNLCPLDKPQDVYSCIGEIVSTSHTFLALVGYALKKLVVGLSGFFLPSLKILTVFFLFPKVASLFKDRPYTKCPLSNPDSQ